MHKDAPTFALESLKRVDNATQLVRTLAQDGQWDALDEALDQRLEALKAFDAQTSLAARNEEPLASEVARLRTQEKELAEFLEREKSETLAALTHLRRRRERPYRDEVEDAAVLDRHA